MLPNALDNLLDFLHRQYQLFVQFNELSMNWKALNSSFLIAFYFINMKPVICIYFSLLLMTCWFLNQKFHYFIETWQKTLFLLVSLSFFYKIRYGHYCCDHLIDNDNAIINNLSIKDKLLREDISFSAGKVLSYKVFNSIWKFWLYFWH